MEPVYQPLTFHFATAVSAVPMSMGKSGTDEMRRIEKAAPIQRCTRHRARVTLRSNDFGVRRLVRMNRVGLVCGHGDVGRRGEVRKMRCLDSASVR